MKKLVIFWALSMTTLCYSQKVSVDKKSEKIKGESGAKFLVLNLPSESVSLFLPKFYFYTAKILENIKKFCIGSSAADTIAVWCCAFGFCTKLFNHQNYRNIK